TEAYLKEANAVYKTLQIVRGNRAYMLMGGMPKGKEMNDVDAFLQSLELQPYEASTYSEQRLGGFVVKAPGSFTEIPEDSTERSLHFSKHYSVRNPTDLVIYDVFVQTFSPYYWVANDSTYFYDRIAQYKRIDDSLVKKEWIQNGGVKGLDIVVKIPGHNSLRKVRMLVSGDTLYTLNSMIPSQEIDAPHHQAFFNEFALIKEAPPAIYTPKVAALLAALQSRDSAVLEDAREQLRFVEFRKEDLPALQQSLLKSYADSEEYSSVKNSLVGIVSQLADSGTVAFIEQNYDVKSEDPNTKYALLAVLAKMQTSHAYGLLKTLLLSRLPAAGDPAMLHSALYDSLPLTAKLFPELLQHSADSLLGHTIAIHANNLLDSNLLTANDMKPYHDEILKGATKAAALARTEKEELWNFSDWAFFAGSTKSEKGNALLRQMLLLKDVYVKQAVILALLKNNQPVSAAEITKVAADKVQRIYFYSELKKRKKESLFPALYASQKSLAESELYNFIGDEYTDDFTLTYAGERIEEYEGSKKRFHLFKLRMAYDEEKKQDFLAVAGPYEINAKEKLTSSGASGFYTGEEFSAAKMKKLLKAYLQELKPAEE
ncbi:MAG TPA: hypothetical protein VMR70_13310, partial [Flavisolibacter sp.]|nr:hypothetical protein [Flavisolibacter sp.]